MLLPSCLLYGMSYETFYKSTPRELMYWLDAMRSNDTDTLKTNASLAFWVVHQIAKAFNSPKELPKTVKEAFPDLFNVVIDEELQQLAFLEGAKRINRSKERSD